MPKLFLNIKRVAYERSSIDLPAPTRRMLVVVANVIQSKSLVLRLPPEPFTVIKAFDPIVERPEIAHLSWRSLGRSSGKAKIHLLKKNSAYDLQSGRASMPFAQQVKFIISPCPTGYWGTSAD